MPRSSSLPILRKSIEYFEGVNSLVAHNLSKVQELEHAENARTSKIGLIEKRQGTRRLGNEVTSTGNYGLFYFESSNASSNHFFKIMTVSATTSVYYLNTSSNWTALTGGGTSLTASSFSYVSAEGCMFLVSGRDFNRYIKSDGTTVVTSATASGNLYNCPISKLINYYKDKLYVGDYALNIGSSTTQFDITNSAGTTYRYTYDTTGTDPVINTTSTSTVKIGDTIVINAQNFTAANNGSFTVTNVASNYFDITNAAGVAENNKTIGTGFIYSDSTRYKTGIMRSSMPVGIVSLVAGDHPVPTTTLNVTDTKFIQASDSLDVYRGATKIQTITVTNKTEDTLTVTATTSAINSADEIWVAGTYSGPKVFRWADNPSSGVNVKQYDTFKLTGNENDALTMMTNIGNVMVIANKNNMGIWNDSSLENYDLGIGCVSKKAYVKHMGVLFFLHYTGIYASTGGAPKLMSAKVERYLSGATKAGLEAGAMGKKGYSIFAAIGDVTLYKLDGSTENTLTDVVLEYNVRQENWYVHIGLDITEFTTYKGSTDVDRLIFVGSTGHAYELFYGTKDNNLTEIPWRIDTKNITLASRFENLCYPKKIIIEAERGTGIKAFISLDNKDWYEIQGEAMKGLTVFKVTPRSADEEARCRKIRISLREYSDRLCSISRIAIVYTESIEEESYHE